MVVCTYYGVLCTHVNNLVACKVGKLHELGISTIINGLIIFVVYTKEKFEINLISISCDLL